MKGEYLDNTKSETQNIFSKLQHHQTQTQHQHQHPHPHHLHPQHHSFPNPFQVITQRECQSEEEDTSRTSSGTATITTNPSPQNPKPITDPNNPSGDGATIEVIRRPRGRPPGSKNKPKPPVIITRDSEPPMSPYILEVTGGNDVVEAVSRFCCRKNIGLCILTGSGTVANVTLRQPSTTPGATVTFHGRFDILSISATFLPQASSSLPVSVPSGFTISLAGPQGQIVGGLVAGALIAAGTVYVIGASFNNPSYHRLPGEDEVGRNSGSGDAHSPPMSGGADSVGHAQPPSQSCGMSMYSCHLPTDVIWAPTARQPPPPPPY